jgi:hypothetical protein
MGITKAVSFTSFLAANLALVAVDIATSGRGFYLPAMNAGDRFTAQTTDGMVSL